MKLWKPLLAVALLLASTQITNAAITGSAHDFSVSAWNASGEICLPCHVPHAADTTLVAPLWNHALTSSTYTTYGGTAGVTGTTALDSYSLLCMSCHDGTVAIDSFGGATGTTFMTGIHLIGSDISNDHPIGNTAIYPLDGTNPGFTAKTTLPLTLRPLGADSVVSCTSCHDVHNTQNQVNLLQVSNAASALCLTCHIK